MSGNTATNLQQRPSGRAGQIQVRPIDRVQHAALALSLGASTLQTPQWAQVKAEWTPESLGWFDAEGNVLGAALVLHRNLPRTKRSLAYIPEGPVLPWERVVEDPNGWLRPLVQHLRARGAFTVRIGPRLPVRIWSAETAKAGMADSSVARFSELGPDTLDERGVALRLALRGMGWTRLGGEDGFAGGQPEVVFQIPVKGRTPEDLLRDMNQEWRRNIRRSARQGVTVRRGGKEDLPLFHALYQETARRDGFTGRPLWYFERMWDALAPGQQGETDEDRPWLRLYVAEIPGDDGPVPLCSSIMVRTGELDCYYYGASSGSHREARASNAVQWQAMRDAIEAGCTVYDMRGIGSTLDPDHPLVGLLRFKAGTGGYVAEYVGEWEMTLAPLWRRGFDLAARLRS